MSNNNGAAMIHSPISPRSPNGDEGLVHEIHNDNVNILIEYQIDIDSFDIQECVNNYSGLACIYRLIFIADHCPKLRSKALRLSISYVTTTMNINLYYNLYAKLNECLRNEVCTDAILVDGELPDLNLRWVESTVLERDNTFNMLDNSLKQYIRAQEEPNNRNNIRRVQNEMASHFVNEGNLTKAIECYTYTRDSSTSVFDFVSTSIALIQVEMYMEKWTNAMSHIDIIQSKTDYLNKVELQKTFDSTIKCLTGLVELSRSKYKMAAENFFKTDIENIKLIKVVQPNDVAIYGGLCALATFNHLELKNNIISNNLVNSFLEYAPEIRNAVFKFYEAKYEVCLTILSKIKPSLLLDMYIGPHIYHLYPIIRKNALVQYFQPYDCADLRKMALCFNTPLVDLENELVKLILAGDIKARIDSVNKMLHAKKINQREETFNKIITMSEQYNKQLHMLILKNETTKFMMKKYDKDVGKKN